MEFYSNLPIKYTILKAEKFNGVYIDTAAYVVSKCFVVSDTIDYSHGDSKQFFYVVNAAFIDYKKNIIVNRLEYDDLGECLNTTRTINVFDTYKEAKHLALGYNKNLIDNSGYLLSNISVDMDLEQVELDKIKEIEEYYKLEAEMLRKINNLKITKKHIKRLIKERL